MKINYYFRNRDPRNNSFENIFSEVIRGLPSACEVKKISALTTLDWKTTLSLRNENADVHHITGAVNYMALGLPGEKTVLTVHDIGFYENPKINILKRKFYGYFWFKLPLARVKFITVVSSFTKEKLIAQFGVDSDRIHVIHNPVLPHFKRRPIRLPRETIQILHIGSGDHKNLKGLLLASQGLAVHIIKVGRISDSESELIRRYRISIEQYESLSNEAVDEIYGRSDILYFASFYEGFGMPIVEAQTVGKPVITSNFGAMKEVSDDSAILVDPFNIDEIRNAIKSLMDDSVLYSDLVNRGIANASRFSFSCTVDQYYSLYRTINND